MVKLAYINPLPPFAVWKETGHEGLAIDIVEQSLRRSSVNVAFLPAAMNEVQDLVLAQKIQGIAFLALNSARRRIYDFSDPYIFTGGALFVKSSNPPPGDLKELMGRIVTTPDKGPHVDYIAKEFPTVNLLTVADYRTAMEAVLEGRADAAALDIEIGTHLSSLMFPGKFTLPERVFNRSVLAVAVLKDTQGSLLKLFNDGLEKIKEDGIYTEITKKWLRDRPPAAFVREYLQNL